MHATRWRTSQACVSKLKTRLSAAYRFWWFLRRQLPVKVDPHFCSSPKRLETYIDSLIIPIHSLQKGVTNSSNENSPPKSSQSVCPTTQFHLQPQALPGSVPPSPWRPPCRWRPWYGRRCGPSGRRPPRCPGSPAWPSRPTSPLRGDRCCHNPFFLLGKNDQSQRKHQQK